MELWIFLWNAAVFLMYGLDKWFAKCGAWRISERVLLMVAFCGGAIGAQLGMIVFHHKTKKPLFCVLVPLAILVNVGLYLWYLSGFRGI